MPSPVKSEHPPTSRREENASQNALPRPGFLWEESRVRAETSSLGPTCFFSLARLNRSWSTRPAWTSSGAFRPRRRSTR